MKGLYERIDDLRKLKHNWDSYGAHAPQDAAIGAARCFARLLMRHTEDSLVQAVPTNDGGVALMGIDCSGDELSIEFRPDGTWKLDDCVPAAVEVSHDGLAARS